MKQAQRLTVLVASPCGEDRISLNSIFSRMDWASHHVQSCQDAVRLLRALQVDVVLTEAAFPDGATWRGLLEEIKSMQEAPSIRDLLTARLRDGDAVRRRGGVSVMTRRVHP